MSYHFETLQLHVGQEQPDPATGARAVPIYQTTSYVFRDCAQAAARFGLTDAGNIYGRLTNSTQDVLEQRVAALEGGVAALATASGAAAVTYTIQALARQGDHIVAQKTIYGGTYNLLAHTLPQYGITATFVDAHDAAAVEAAIQPNTRAVYLETLGTRTATFRTSRPLPPSPTATACRSSSTTRSARPTGSRSSRSARTSSSTPPRSSSAATARHSAASSSTPVRSTGRPAAAIRSSPRRTPATTASRSCRPRARQPL